MTKSWVDMQVLSPTAPGLHALEADIALPLARNLNDITAATQRG